MKIPTIKMNKVEEAIRFIIGTTITVTGITLGIIYVGISEPTSFIEQVKAVIFQVIMILSIIFFGAMIIYDEFPWSNQRSKE